MRAIIEENHRKIIQDVAEELNFEQDTIFSFLKAKKKVKYFDKWVSYDLNEKQKLIQKSVKMWLKNSILSKIPF